MTFLGGPAPSNLQFFLSCLEDLNRLWHPGDYDAVEYFVLQDLWDCYDEWSAYGAGTPIALDGGETLVQYYVTYLSAIQIYTTASSLSNIRYPIYHIPLRRTVKDLSACFLTYHTLSSSFQESDGPNEEMGCAERKWDREGIALPPFGLATYKMQGRVWVSGGDGGDHDRLLSPFSAADSWLKQLGVRHHEFNYFRGIRRGWSEMSCIRS
ncbi:hypothetical protein COCNU_14G006300 [Cocos nucifera]|uniref:Uncharacterized protein n=1 Tax=Cocos nucifera TaxID=13894 RepID=A0A8K0IUX5_COCNU|nr:hypothetical protein COCNU_14G006300 [Cocos nucifera]